MLAGDNPHVYCKIGWYCWEGDWAWAYVCVCCLYAQGSWKDYVCHLRHVGQDTGWLLQALKTYEDHQGLALAYLYGLNKTFWRLHSARIFANACWQQEQPLCHLSMEMQLSRRQYMGSVSRLIYMFRSHISCQPLGVLFCVVLLQIWILSCNTTYWRKYNCYDVFVSSCFEGTFQMIDCVFSSMNSFISFKYAHNPCHNKPLHWNVHV